jgi:tRNA ligase
MGEELDCGSGGELPPIFIRRSRLHYPQLCDDGFEEHVLPYSADKTGLHLHGLNECSKDFKTQPTAVVDKFAREWGFIVTASYQLPSISKVKAFTEEIGRNGTWNGEALEGFVVRTTVGLPPTKGSASADASPYSPGSSFFFKIKFDEPYMMYRDWREITKSLLSKGESAKLPKNKMERPETKTYVAWVKGDIKRNPSLFEGYSKGHGIIATRERFLEWLETDEGKRGKKKAETDKEATRPLGKKFGKTVIMPIAVPGVGTPHPCSARGVGLLRTSSRQNLNLSGSNRTIPPRSHTER